MKACSGVIRVGLSRFLRFVRMIFGAVDVLGMKIGLEIKLGGKFVVNEGFTSKNGRGCRRGRKR